MKLLVSAQQKLFVLTNRYLLVADGCPGALLPDGDPPADPLRGRPRPRPGPRAPGPGESPPGQAALPQR